VHDEILQLATAGGVFRQIGAAVEPRREFAGIE
jgi:hypothetical protein